MYEVNQIISKVNVSPFIRGLRLTASKNSFHNQFIQNKSPCSCSRGGACEQEQNAFYSANQPQKITLGGSATPTNNMGVTEQSGHLRKTLIDSDYLILDSPEPEKDDDGTELPVLVPTGKNGKFKMVRVPNPSLRTDGKAAFIDQCSFTVYISKMNPPQGKNAVSAVADALSEIFGFSATSKRDKGINCYEHSYVLGNKYGHLNFGGQNETINVQITGTGCSKAKAGWEKRLYDFLESHGGRLTRADAAADFFNGEYTPEQAEQDYLDGNMSLTNRNPFAERRGDWYNNRGGKTMYIGKRTSGKLLRVYEKGKQLLGEIALRTIDPEHELSSYLAWVRVECELHNNQRIIPLDILLEPGKYLAGAYPALAFISEVQERINTIKKTAVATIERAKAVFKHQFGAWLYSFLALEGEQVIHDLMKCSKASWADFNGNVPEDNIVDGIGREIKMYFGTSPS